MEVRRLAGTAVAVVVLGGVGAVAVLLGDRGDEPSRTATTTPSANPPADPETRRAAAAEEALSRLEAAVESSDRAAFADVYDGRRGATLYRALTRLPLSTWDLRFVAEQSAAGDQWVGDVEARWSLRRFDQRAAGTEIEVRFGYDGEEASVERIDVADDAYAPEWLLGRVEVRRADDVLVISARPGLTPDVVRQARQAVRDVRSVVTGSKAPIVVVVPDSTSQLGRLLGERAGDYRSIAAVTTTVDGTSLPTSPVRIAINPPVYRGLGTAGAQVVLSHEATHAVTGAAVSAVPLWLVEGFADYVALADEPVPLDVAAAQILRQVRSDGPPRRLPSDDEFAASASRLGANYEAAWLACRMIAEQDGAEALLRFYRRALETGDLDAALQHVLGTDTATLTDWWRAYLQDLA